MIPPLLRSFTFASRLLARRQMRYLCTISIPSDLQEPNNPEATKGWELPKPSIPASELTEDKPKRRKINLTDEPIVPVEEDVLDEDGYPVPIPPKPLTESELELLGSWRSSFEKSVVSEDPEAQWLLGKELYRSDQPTDETRAFNKAASVLFFSSATLGFPSACANLGRMYMLGYGVVKNYKLAVKFLAVAADNGDITSRGHLGGMYFKGWGVKKNPKEAWRLLEEASRFNNPRAQRWFAEIHEEGLGVEKDFHIALRYAERSAAQANMDKEAAREAASVAGRMYSSIRDYKTAFRFFKQSAELGYPIGMANLGYMMLQGAPPEEKNLVLAKLWLKQASHNGISRAQRDLGTLCLEDHEESEEDLKQDMKEALYWLNIAAEGGYIDAHFRLGEVYASGSNRYQGIQQNLSIARKHFEYARELSSSSKERKDKLPAGVWARLERDPLQARTLIDTYEMDGRLGGDRVRKWRGDLNDLDPTPKPRPPKMK